MFYQVGPSSLMALVFVAISTIVTSYALNRIVSLQKFKLLFTEQRNRLTSEFINHIRIIRLNGWETVLIDKIIQARNEELDYLAATGHLNHSFSAWVMMSSPRIQAVLIFAMYVYTGNLLTLTIAFSTFTIFTTMS